MTEVLYPFGQEGPIYTQVKQLCDDQAEAGYVVPAGQVYGCFSTVAGRHEMEVVDGAGQTIQLVTTVYPAWVDNRAEWIVAVATHRPGGGIRMVEEIADWGHGVAMLREIGGTVPHWLVDRD